MKQRSDNTSYKNQIDKAKDSLVNDVNIEYILDIGNWDTSDITNMIGLFLGRPRFNQDISGWNVKKVTDMSYMFSGAEAFNKNIGNWNVEKVTNMSYMFSGATIFNADISDWNVENVTNMSFMFSDATTFNKRIRKWIINKTNVIFTNMFSRATAMIKEYRGVSQFEYVDDKNVTPILDFFTQTTKRALNFLKRNVVKFQKSHVSIFDICLNSVAPP